MAGVVIPWDPLLENIFKIIDRVDIKRGSHPVIMPTPKKDTISSGFTRWKAVVCISGIGNAGSSPEKTRPIKVAVAVEIATGTMVLTLIS